MNIILCGCLNVCQAIFIPNGIMYIFIDIVKQTNSFTAIKITNPALVNEVKA